MNGQPRPDDSVSPLFALVLVSPFPLALGALLSDWAYTRSYEVQWINFADWLVAGSLAFAVIALVAEILRITVRGRWGQRDETLALASLLGFIVVQFVNALTHSKDAYATMPAALVLSILTTILAFVALWLGIAGSPRGRNR